MNKISFIFFALLLVGMHIQSDQTLAIAGSVNGPTQSTPLVPKKQVLSLAEIIEQRKRCGEWVFRGAWSSLLALTVIAYAGNPAIRCPAHPEDQMCEPEDVEAAQIICGVFGGAGAASFGVFSYNVKQWCSLWWQERKLKAAQRDTESAQ